jgi:ribosomal protein S18 acetylase RimI-like enzyme
VAEKGYRELFAAARRVRTSVPEARFLVVGSPDADKPDAITEAEIERARADVTFAGWREDVRDLYALMDVFVLPSWREGVPRSAIEAAAMGRPMVVSDIRGCREVVRDGAEGLLVPPRSPAPLAGAIRALLGDPQARERMGEAARARAEERFDERRVLEIVVEATRSVLARAGRHWSARTATSPARSTVVRPAGPGDARAMARLHRESLPDSFLPTLGDGFLRRLYRALSADPRAVTLVAERDSMVVGFAAGTRSVRGSYRRFLLRDGLGGFIAAAPRLVRPSVLRRVLETARYPRRADRLPESELLAIAVEDAWRSTGVGRALADRVLDELARLGAPAVKVVVHAENQDAIRFYQRLGFRPAARIAIHDGEVSNVLVIERNRRGHA